MRASGACSPRQDALATIAAISTAVPPHVITQQTAREFAAAFFAPQVRDIERLLHVFDHAGIETRHISMPMEWFLSPRSFPEKNDRYVHESTRLGAEVLRRCSETAAIPLSDITHLVFVSTTGLATPSIDSRLLNTLGLSRHLVRTPVWGLGCAGGAAGLALAGRLTQADPTAVVALVCVELCSLTFHSLDYSQSNVVATALFGDGAAGLLIVGAERGERLRQPGPRLRAARTTTWPDSLDVMGWNFDAVGMQVVFSKAIPKVVREHVYDNTLAFLDAEHLTYADIRHWIVHPGGAKVIAAYQDVLPVPARALDPARAVLRAYGNMSSPTVLFVLERVLRHESVPAGALGLLTALGPGFSSENLLLEF